MEFDETGETLSFAELDRRSDALANVLSSLGVGAGDRVAAMLRNCPDYPITWFGAMKAGASMVPLNVKYRVTDAGYVLSHSGAKVLVTADEFRALIASIDREGLALTSLCVIDRATDDGDARSLPRLLDRAPEGSPRVEVLPETVSTVQYTSGTTGLPKGCMMTQRTWIGMASVVVRDFPRIDTADVLIIAQPFYYADLPWYLTATLMGGARLVALDGFHPSSLWQKIQQYRATFYYCLGVMPNLLMEMPVRDNEHDHAMRAVAVSGLAPELREAVRLRFGVGWYDFYGMTEVGWIAYERPGEQDDVGALACVGRAARGREIRVADAGGNRLPRGETSEFLVRGAGLFDGYFRQPDATAAAFHEGWFRHRRCRLDGRPRPAVLRRPDQGHDPPQRREHRRRRGRGDHCHPPCGVVCSMHRGARRFARRGGEGLCRAVGERAGGRRPDRA